MVGVPSVERKNTLLKQRRAQPLVKLALFGDGLACPCPCPCLNFASPPASLRDMKPILRLLSVFLVVAILVSPSATGTRAEGDRRRDKRLAQLLRWLEEGGVDLKAVKAEWTDRMGWVLRANRPIAPNDMLLKVPRRLLLGPHQLKGSHLDKLAGRMEVPDRMLLLLMCERVNSSSFFRPYLDLLPSKVDTPISWSMEEARELVGSWVLSKAVRLRHELSRSYQQMKEEVRAE
eukprot:750307-Hanusia_phi.AAC.2